MIRRTVVVLVVIGLAFFVAGVASAQSLCKSTLGTSGGVVTSDEGATLRARWAPAISGRGTTSSGAVLRAGFVAGPCPQTATAVDPGLPNVRSTHLHAVAPNPFNPRASVRFDLARRGAVELAVFDAAGRRVTTLLDAALDAGAHEVALDGADLASGVYHVRLHADGVVQTRPVVLIK